MGTVHLAPPLQERGIYRATHTAQAHCVHSMLPFSKEVYF